MSPCSVLIDTESNHLSSGSLVTTAIETPLDLPQQTPIAAKNKPSGWDSFVTTHDEINTTRLNPSPPMFYNSATSTFIPSPNPSFPPKDGLPPPLSILPDSVSPLRRHRLSPRPVVCKKHFNPCPEDAPFHPYMNRARARPEFCEPAMLKRTFCSRNKGGCPVHRSRCFTIHVGPSRNQCRTESVALRIIQIVLGLCWTCNTW